MRRVRIRQLLGVVAAALLALSLWPIPYLAAPSWTVSVVTDDGRALVGVNVRLVYQNYSTEGDSHELTSETDREGHARFTAQYQSASLVQRLYHSLSSAGAGAHASFGRHAHVFVFGRGYEGTATDGRFVTDWRGTPDAMESTIIAKSLRR